MPSNDTLIEFPAVPRSNSLLARASRNLRTLWSILADAVCFCFDV